MLLNICQLCICNLCRVNDTSQQWAEFRFAPINSVGVYQPTTGQSAALYPQLANTTTFITPLARDWYPQQFAQFNHAQVRHSMHPSPARAGVICLNTSSPACRQIHWPACQLSSRFAIITNFTACPLV